MSNIFLKHFVNLLELGLIIMFCGIENKLFVYREISEYPTKI